MMNTRSALSTSLLTVSFSAIVLCGEYAAEAASAATLPDRNMAVILFGAEPPVMTAAPATSPAAVELGRKLYHEVALSKGSDVSCNSCHDLGNYGQDGKKVAAGGNRNTLSTFNAARQVSQFWDGRAPSIEELPSAEKHGLKSAADIEKALTGADGYADLFKKAFPADSNPVKAKNVGIALGAFQRQLVTKSRFDKYLDGDENALTGEEKAGLDGFIAAGCVACHTTRLMGGHMIQKLGLVKPVTGEDQGRFQLTGNEVDKQMWKVPQLLNVEKTGPYMHDGSIASLEEVTKYMADVQLGRALSDAETKSITAFLKSLTGEPPAAAKAGN